MGALIGRYKPGENVPGFATAQVNAGRFVKVTDAPTGDGAYPIAHCGSGERAFGVAEADSGPTTHDAHSQTRIVNVARRGTVSRLVAGAAVEAPALVMSDSQGRAVTFAESAAGQASLATGVVGSNNAITWTALEGGDDGNDISVTLVDPPGNNVALSVDVDGKDIVVTLATDGSSVVTSTAAQVIAAVQEHDTASQLVSVANTGASNGSGVVAAVAETNLSGGGGSGSSVALGQALKDAAQAGDIIEVDLF